MNNSFFYHNLEENTVNKKCRNFLDAISRYSEHNNKLVYVLNKPLGEYKFKYEFSDGVIILVPKYKIFFVNFNNNNNGFEDFIEDFIEDIGYISTKYDFKQELGRPKKWKDECFYQFQYDEIINTDIEDILRRIRLKNKAEERRIELLISLISGNINDVNRVGGNVPETNLEKIKKNIVLFDGDQTRFIYQEPLGSKKIRIQGLAGTGKTELLLHKIRKLYTEESHTKIAFTCFNKILVENLKSRIPDFFDFMKVEEQIKWNDRLWVMGSWGSKGYKNSGIYSYICSYYNIPFSSYRDCPNFGTICERTLELLRTRVQ